MLMGADAKPKIERQRGTGSGCRSNRFGGRCRLGLVAQKDDLVIGFMQPSSSDAIISVIDGKTPSAADNPVLKGLAKQEGSFFRS